MLQHTYSHDIMHKKIAILGVYPPPLGGISVHIKRVAHKLKQQNNCVRIFDTTHRGNQYWYAARLIGFMLRMRPEIVYYHTYYLNSTLREFQIVSYLKRIGFKLVVIEHNCRHMDTRDAAYKKHLNALLKQVDHLVFIGDSTHKSYIENSIEFPHSISIEAAFLPPNLSEESRLYVQYPAKLKHFIAKQRPLIIANASSLRLWQGKDLYGIDRCIKLVCALRMQYPEIGLVVAIASVADTQYFEELQHRVAKHNIDKQVYFLLGQYELWPLLKFADIFVRPTRSDGESVSIREACSLGIPVVASDACRRPEQAKVFHNQEEFFNQVQESIYQGRGG